MLVFDDVGALGIGAGEAVLASEAALGGGATGAIGARIGHGAGSLSGMGALGSEMALGEGVLGDFGAGIGFGLGSLSGIGALGGEAAYGSGESTVFFLGNSSSSSLSLFFPCFTGGESSIGCFCFLCRRGGDVKGGLGVDASSSALSRSSPSCDLRDSPVVCFCLFGGSAGDGEGGPDAAA